MVTTFIRIGISVTRWHHLNHTDPAFKTWAQGVLTAVRDTFELVALDEGGTRWRSARYAYRARCTDELPIYHVNIRTPPARAEWLEVLG